MTGMSVKSTSVSLSSQQDCSWDIDCFAGDLFWEWKPRNKIGKESKLIQGITIEQKQL